MLIKQLPPVINGRDGKPIVLNEHELAMCEELQPVMNTQLQRILKNSLGYEVQITTLTTIMKKISEAKYFEVAPADYLPVRVGEGAWSSNLTTYRSFALADDFETGVVDTGGENSRLASADAGIDALNIKVFQWAKSIGWSIMDLEIAAKSGNWDLVSAKEEARKKNWDLGIQRIAFLGAKGQNGSGGTCLGLLNQAGITFNTSLLTQSLSSLTSAQLKTFTAQVVGAYRQNCNYTAFPTHLIIPESDYDGLASQASPDFPIKSTYELLLDAFKLITRKPDFKILPLAYADAANSGGVLTKQTYCLLNYDEKSVRMDVPVDYTNTLANSINNFQFQNVGFGQFTGVLAYRPLEMLYFGY